MPPIGRRTVLKLVAGGTAWATLPIALAASSGSDGAGATAREAVLTTGLRGGAHAGAVETLFDFLSDFQIETAIIEALNQQRTLRQVLRDPARANRNLRKAVGVGPGELREAVITEIAGGYIPTADDHLSRFHRIEANPESDEFVDRLARMNPERPDKY